MKQEDFVIGATGDFGDGEFILFKHIPTGLYVGFEEKTLSVYWYNLLEAINPFDYYSLTIVKNYPQHFWDYFEAVLEEFHSLLNHHKAVNFCVLYDGPADMNMLCDSIFEVYDDDSALVVAYQKAEPDEPDEDITHLSVENFTYNELLAVFCKRLREAEEAIGTILN